MMICIADDFSAIRARLAELRGEPGYRESELVTFSILWRPTAALLKGIEQLRALYPAGPPPPVPVYRDGL